MASGRFFHRTARLAIFAASVALALCTAMPGLAADPVTLIRKPEADELSRVTITLQVGGDLKLTPPEGKEKLLGMSVNATFAYDEQLLKTDSPVTATRRSVRYYDDAQATIKVDKGGEKSSLRPERRSIAVNVSKTQNTLYSTSGPLTREEVDLLDVPCSSLVIDELLPADPVAAGSTWKHSDQVMAALLGLEAVSFSDTQSVLADVKDDVAKMTMGGKVSGAVGGVGTEIEIKAKYHYDLKLKRITWFALLVKEKRSVGHIGPGLDVVAKVILKIAPISASKGINPAAVKLASGEPPARLTRLGYECQAARVKLQYDRKWYVTGEDANLAILRMVDRGDLVAQCNVAPVTTSVKKDLTLADFQQEVKQSLGKNFGQFVHAAEATNDQGYRVYRVDVQGEASKLPIRWIYYFVASPQGARASLVFTHEQELTEKFGDADKRLVASLRFVGEPTETAGKPTPKKAD